MGGGGSILTVPILVYVLEMDPKVAIALSLAIVGLTSLIGIYGHYKNGNINFKIAALFAPFAMIGTFSGAKISVYLSGQAQLILFSIIMILAAIFMFKNARKTAPNNEIEEETAAQLNYIVIAMQGIVIGIVTGLVGVGGGFLIVPALVLLTKIPMKKALGTSLVIIALNSLSGFTGYLGQVNIPWQFLFIFSAFSGGGILVGTKLVKYVSQKQLKLGFSIFLLLMGAYIIYKNRMVFGL